MLFIECINFVAIKTHFFVTENPDIDPNTFYPDKRYNHIAQVQERLNFLRFLLKVRLQNLCLQNVYIVYNLRI